jgi:hypothetical protein
LIEAGLLVAIIGWGKESGGREDSKRTVLLVHLEGGGAIRRTRNGLRDRSLLPVFLKLMKKRSLRQYSSFQDKSRLRQNDKGRDKAKDKI